MKRLARLLMALGISCSTPKEKYVDIDVGTGCEDIVTYVSGYNNAEVKVDDRIYCSSNGDLECVIKKCDSYGPLFSQGKHSVCVEDICEDFYVNGNKEPVEENTFEEDTSQKQVEEIEEGEIGVTCTQDSVYLNHVICHSSEKGKCDWYRNFKKLNEEDCSVAIDDAPYDGINEYVVEKNWVEGKDIVDMTYEKPVIGECSYDNGSINCEKAEPVRPDGHDTIFFTEEQEVKLCVDYDCDGTISDAENNCDVKKTK